MQLRVVVLLILAAAGAAQAQNNPLIRLNPASMALYRQAEPLDKAGDTAGVIAVWRTRVDAGDDLGQFETGAVLLRSPATSPEAARGLDLVRKSAASGFVRAQVRLYALYRSGFPPLIEPDPAQAIAWLRRAVDQGFPPAMVHLGLAYVNGIGVERNPREAFALFQRAAERTHPFGHFAVGAAYESGIGVAPDLERARQAYRQAIERATWMQTRPNVPYVFRPVYEKWVADSQNALAGLDSPVAATPAPAVEEERRRLEAEQARIAEERRRIAAESARLAAERRRAAQEAEQRAAAERKQAEDARLAEERRRLEAERTKLAEERRRLEAENARLAEEERRRAAERKQAEEARLAEERRKLEAEQAKIAEERRKVEAETARVAAERQRAAQEQARALEAQPAPAPAATAPAATATAPAASQGGENDLATTFGRFVKGIAAGAQVIGGVRVALGGVRVRDENQVSQGANTIAAALGIGVAGNTGSLGTSAPTSNAASPSGNAGGGRIPQAGASVTGGSYSGDCDAGAKQFDAEFGPTAQRLSQEAQRSTSIVRQTQLLMYILDTQIKYLEQACQGRPELAGLKRTYAGALNACRGTASNPSDCVPRQ